MKLASLLKNLQVTPKISLIDELIQIRASNLQPSSKGNSNYHFSSIPQTIGRSSKWRTNVAWTHLM